MMETCLVVWSLLGFLVLSSNTCSAFNIQKVGVDENDVSQSESSTEPCKKQTRSIADSKQYDINSSNKQKATRNDILGRNVDWPPEDNCTDDDITAIEPVMYDHWKLHIIMACTVTAAVEFVIIIFIILYWKQIRWTLRKITCPCDDCRQHEAMEPDQQGQHTDVQSDEQSEAQSYVQANIHIDMQQSYPVRNPPIGTDQPTSNQMVHTFAAPWYSRVECGDAETDDLAVPGPSGLSSTFEVLIHQSSDSDDSLGQVKPHRTVITKKHVKGIKGQKMKSTSKNHIELSPSGGSGTTNCWHDVGDGKCGPNQGSQCAMDQNSPITQKVDGHMTDCGQVSAITDC